MLFSYITLFIFSIIIHLILRMKQDQKELPKELFAVKIYALVTNEPKLQTSGKRRRPKNSPRMIRSWKMPLFGGLMGQLICLIMYWLVSKFLGHQFCRLSFVSYTFSFFVLAKIFFEIICTSKSQLMLYHLATIFEIHDLCRVHVHIILRGIC